MRRERGIMRGIITENRSILKVVISMKNSVKEIKLNLHTRFADSADLTIREISLKSTSSLTAAVITMEGLVDKEQLAQSVLNPLMV